MKTKLYCITNGKIFLTKGMKKGKNPHFWGSKRNFNLAVINGCLNYWDYHIRDWVSKCSDFVVCIYEFCNKTKEIQLIKQTPLLDYVENERKKRLEKEKERTRKFHED